MEATLTDDEQRALNELCPADRRTGDLRQDLIAAVKEAMRRREQNTLDGGAVLQALHREVGTWRTIGKLTGLSFSTANRWGKPFREAEREAERAVS